MKMYIFVAMNQEERKEAILQMLRKDGTLRVETLAARLGVSGATLRSDLRILESQQAVRRAHGIVSPSTLNVKDLPVDQKYNIRREQKMRIGAYAASMIDAGDSVLITSGTTIEAFAMAFPSGLNVNAATSSIRVATFLSTKERVNTLVLGGTLVPNSLSVRDDYSLTGLKNIHVGKLFFSCDGFDLHAGVTTAFPQEARLTCRMIECSDQAILLADSAKLGRIGFGQICGWDTVDILVTDTDIPSSVREAIEAMNVKVITV